LTIAAEIGNVDICSLLFFFGVSATRPPEEKRQPLICAARNGHLKICELLIRQGADIDATSDSSPKSALWYAAQRGDLECCQLLIARGASGVLQDKRTVLVAAAKSGNLQLFNWLLAVGVPLNSGPGSTTPLVTAIEYLNIDIVRRLIELKVDLNEREEEFRTPLTLACYLKFSEAASLLVEAGADPLMKDYHSDTPLKLAAKAGNVDLLSLMIKKGVRLKNEKSEAYFALSEAINYRRLDAVKFLLKNGAPTFFQSTGIAENRPKALIHVLLKDLWCQNNFDEILDLLLKHQVPINEVNQAGNNALMVAAIDNRPELVRNLLRRGALVSQKNMHGDDALSIAIKNAEIALDARGVPYDFMGNNLATLAFIVDDLQRSPFYLLYRDEAFRQTENRIIRDMLPNIISTLPLSPGTTTSPEFPFANISKFSELI